MASSSRTETPFLLSFALVRGEESTTMTRQQTEQDQALDTLRQRATAELESTTSIDSLEEWRTRYLGRERGELSAILKGVGALPAEQRKAVGQAANAVKTQLEGLLEARSQELHAAEQAAALERE